MCVRICVSICWLNCGMSYNFKCLRLFTRTITSCLFVVIIIIMQIDFHELENVYQNIIINTAELTLSFVVSHKLVSQCLYLEFYCNKAHFFQCITTTILLNFYFIIWAIVSLIYLFLFSFFPLELDRERARYEATVHLGNTSSQAANDIRTERRRIMEYLPVFLEKHVSKKDYPVS